MTEETKDFQSKSIFGQRFDPEVPEPLTKANGRSILYKVKLKSDCDQPGTIIAPIDKTKFYVAKFIEPYLRNFGNTRVNKDELLTPSGRVQREVDVIAAIDHPNIVKIFGYWEEKPPIGYAYPGGLPTVKNEEGVLFILMEYCDLVPLDKWLSMNASSSSSNFNKEKALHGLILFRQFMEALAHLHSKKIIHRDLKPENIVLTSDLSSETAILKLVDYGLATEKKSTMTSQLGTFYYKSPELRKSGAIGGNKYETSVDIYPAGIILCLILVATSLQERKNVLEDFESYMKGRLDTVGKLEQGLLRHFDPASFIEKFRSAIKDKSEKMEKLLILASKMTEEIATKRPTAEHALTELILICPELLSDNVKIPYWTCLSEKGLKEFEYAFSPDEPFHKISQPRLSPLTHLKLLNVKLSTTNQLCHILKHTPLLNYLHIEANFTDEGLSSDFKLSYYSPFLEDLQESTLQLLKTIIIKEVAEDAINIVSQKRIASMMFGVPLSQIAKNNMSVKLSIGGTDFVNIDCDKKTFALCGFGSTPFLSVLQDVDNFENICLQDMTADPSKSNSLSKLNNWAPGLGLQTKAQKLDFQNIPLDLEEGYLLENYEKLTHCYLTCPDLFEVSKLFVKCLASLKSVKVVRLTGFSLDLTKFDYKTDEWELDELHLVKCHLPHEFSQRLEEQWLCVEKDLLISHCPAPKTFQPDYKLFYGILRTNMPICLRLHPFDFTLTPNEKINQSVNNYLHQIPEIVRKGSSIGIQTNSKDLPGITSFISWNPRDIV